MPDNDAYAPERAPPSSEDDEPAAGGESDPPSSDTSDASDPLDPAMLLSLDEADAISSRLVPPELSPELARILRSAEERVGAFDHDHPAISSPLEQDVDLLLPAELLAALDEPIDPEDALSGAMGRGKTNGTTGALTGMQPGTHAGGFAGLGTAVQIGSQLASHVETPLPGRASAETPEASLGRRDLTTPGIAPQVPISVATSVRNDGTVDGAPSAKPRALSEALTGVDMSGPAMTVPGVEGPRSNGTVAKHESIVPLTMGELARATQIPPAPVVASIEAAVAVARPVEASVGASLGASLVASVGASRAAPVPVPAVLQEGDAVRVLARMIASRASGALALGPPTSVRRIVLHDGDIVTTASSAPDETLVAFLAMRGDLERDVAARLAGRLPASGRHAGAALVGHGHLGQDELWPTLRAHAEWIIGQALRGEEGTCELEEEVPLRLRSEPNVFGGATGAEVLLEQIRRVIPPELAIARVGGINAHIAEGAKAQLLGECALRAEEMALVRGAPGKTLGELLEGEDGELANVVYGLAALGVLEIVAPIRKAEAKPAGADRLDDEALRQRVRARMALVEEGDYFALLGVSRSATGYEVRRAYLELRRAFEPGRVLTASTADLVADLRLVLEVLDEAYEILREPNRRDRYRRAIEAGPPSES